MTAKLWPTKTLRWGIAVRRHGSFQDVALKRFSGEPGSSAVQTLRREYGSNTYQLTLLKGYGSNAWINKGVIAE